MAAILKEFDKTFDHRMLHTGQNYDDNLKDVFFKDFEIRKPDKQFNINGNTVGESLSKLFLLMDEEFRENRPDAVVILGDTNSALSGILAKRMKIPFYHLEAGLRSFDKNVPEEINRRIIDHTADFNLVYTEHARRNLISEGLHPRTIALVGSPLTEIISRNFPKIEKSTMLQQLSLTHDEFYLASAHRQENVDDPDRLSALINSLEELSQKSGLPIIFSTHPRTKDKLKKLGLTLSPNIRFLEPFGFNDYCKLQLSARVVLSDSGSVSEEAAMLNFRAITLRDSMERPEALESGSISMSGINSKRFLELISYVESQPLATHHPEEYSIADTSARVVKFIYSTIDEYEFWFGIRR